MCFVALLKVSQHIALLYPHPGQVKKTKLEDSQCCLAALFCGFIIAFDAVSNKMKLIRVGFTSYKLVF